MLRLLSTLRRNTGGVTAVEYRMIAALITIAIIGAITALETSLSGTFTSLAAFI